MGGVIVVRAVIDHGDFCFPSTCFDCFLRCREISCQRQLLKSRGPVLTKNSSLLFKMIMNCKMIARKHHTEHGTLLSAESLGQDSPGVLAKKLALSRNRMDICSLSSMNLVTCG